MTKLICSLSVDTSQLVADLEWLVERLFERFPQGVGERIGNLDRFLPRIREQIIELERRTAVDTGCIVLRFGLGGRTELLAAAIAALEVDVSDVLFHGASL